MSKKQTAFKPYILYPLLAFTGLALSASVYAAAVDDQDSRKKKHEKGASAKHTEKKSHHHAHGMGALGHTLGKSKKVHKRLSDHVNFKRAHHAKLKKLPQSLAHLGSHELVPVVATVNVNVGQDASDAAGGVASGLLPWAKTKALMAKGLGDELTDYMADNYLHLTVFDIDQLYDLSLNSKTGKSEDPTIQYRDPITNPMPVKIVAGPRPLPETAGLIPMAEIDTLLNKGYADVLTDYWNFGQRLSVSGLKSFRNPLDANGKSVNPYVEYRDPNTGKMALSGVNGVPVAARFPIQGGQSNAYHQSSQHIVSFKDTVPQINDAGFHFATWGVRVPSFKEYH